MPQTLFFLEKLQQVFYLIWRKPKKDHFYFHIFFFWTWLFYFVWSSSNNMEKRIVIECCDYDTATQFSSFFVLFCLKNFLKIRKDFFGSAISIDHFGIVFGCNLFSFFIVDNNSFFNSIFSIIKIVSETKKLFKKLKIFFSI